MPAEFTPRNAILDLSREAAAIDLDARDWPELAPRELALTRATWRGRMVNEHISARVFAGLLPQLMAAGISAARQEACAGMIVDELRHGRQCAAVLLRLGEAPVATLPDLAPMPQHAGCTPLEAALRSVVSISCLSETVAVALITAERQEIAHPGLDATLRGILADEVQHARFGWTLLDEVAGELTPAERDRLSRYLTAAFAHLERHELAHLSAQPALSEATVGMGVCDGQEARRLFYDTVADVIVPGLERHGLAAQRAWAERKAA